MSGHGWEIAMILLAAVAGGIVQSLMRSRNEQGKRIGRLERFKDFQLGRMAGLREAERKNRRGSNGQ